MKKYLIIILFLIFFIPFNVSADNIWADTLPFTSGNLGNQTWNITSTNNLSSWLYNDFPFSQKDFSNADYINIVVNHYGSITSQLQGGNEEIEMSLDGFYSITGLNNDYDNFINSSAVKVDYFVAFYVVGSSYNICERTTTGDIMDVWKCPTSKGSSNHIGIFSRYYVPTSYVVYNPRLEFEFNILSYINRGSISSDTSTINNASTNITNSINSSTESITNAQEDTTQAVEDINSSITDSSGNSDSDNNNAIQGFTNKLGTNNTISSLITMPITLYQKVLNSVNGSCSTFNLGNLLGTDISFPCINPSNYLGSSLWSIIDIICSGLLIFAISKRFINIFDGFTSMSTTKDEVGD